MPRAEQGALNTTQIFLKRSRRIGSTMLYRIAYTAVAYSSNSSVVNTSGFLNIAVHTRFSKPAESD